MRLGVAELSRRWTQLLSGDLEFQVLVKPPAFGLNVKPANSFASCRLRFSNLLLLNYFRSFAFLASASVALSKNFSILIIFDSLLWYLDLHVD